MATTEIDLLNYHAAHAPAEVPDWFRDRNYRVPEVAVPAPLVALQVEQDRHDAEFSDMPPEGPSWWYRQRMESAERLNKLSADLKPVRVRHEQDVKLAEAAAEMNLIVAWRFTYARHMVIAAGRLAAQMDRPDGPVVRIGNL